MSLDGDFGVSSWQVVRPQWWKSANCAMFAGVACLPDQIYLIQRILITFGIDFQIRMERNPIIVPPQSLKCSSVPYAFCAISLNLSEALASPQPSKIFPPPQKTLHLRQRACLRKNVMLI